MIEPGTTDDTKYTHYSLLRLVEENWKLGTLKRNDLKAEPIRLAHIPTGNPFAVAIILILILALVASGAILFVYRERIRHCFKDNALADVFQQVEMDGRLVDSRLLDDDTLEVDLDDSDEYQ